MKNIGRSVGLGRCWELCRPTQRPSASGRGKGTPAGQYLALLLALLGCLDEDHAPPTEPPPPAIGTRENPALVTQTVRIRTAEGRLRLTLMDVVSGPQAANQIRNASPANVPPLPGHEYILARFRVQVDSLFTSRPIVVAHGRFVAVSQNGVVYPAVTLAGIAPALSVEMFAGIYEGWTWFQVMLVDRGTTAVFDRQESWQAWFALR